MLFGVARTFLLELTELSATVLAGAIKRLEGGGVTLLLSGVRPEHAMVLTRFGVYDELAQERHVLGNGGPATD
jgi:SulP family sulfate permease